VVPWVCLAIGLVTAVLSLISLSPLRGAMGSVFSFIPGWIVGEAPLHLAAAAAVATVGCGLAGGWASWPGLAGAGLVVAAYPGLAAQFGSGLRSRRHFEEALAEMGQIAPAWKWGHRDSWRVLVALPVRPRGVERLRNVSYAGDERHVHRLDVYRRAGAKGLNGAPVVLYFHGGNWVLGDKREQAIPMLQQLAERGYVCVTANYSLSPKAKWPSHVLDCKLALIWVKRHIAEYGGDPELVFISGGSAGGHLAALVALTANDPAWQPGHEDEDTSMAGCIPLYGVYDFVDPEKLGNANLNSLLEVGVFERSGAEIEALRAASPISRVTESAPPFFLVHGRNDVMVPVPSARAFVEVLRARSNQPVGYAELPLAQHGFDTFWSPRTVHLIHAVEVFTTGVVGDRREQREVGR
jgi:acetyl esterase/lipase